MSAAPARIVGEVLSIRRAGAYHHLTIRTPGIDPGTRPGHFVALAIGGAEPVRLGRRAAVPPTAVPQTAVPEMEITS